MTEDDPTGRAGDRRKGPRRVDDEDVPAPTPDPSVHFPEVFRARARYNRIHAKVLMSDVGPGDHFYEQRRLDAAMAIAEARGLEMVADEIEAAAE